MQGQTVVRHPLASKRCIIVFPTKGGELHSTSDDDGAGSSGSSGSGGAAGADAESEPSPQRHVGRHERREVFDLLSRYAPVAPIGSGSYGLVCSARDSNRVEAFRLSPPPELRGPDGEYSEEGLTPEEKQELFDDYTLVAVKKEQHLFEGGNARLWLCATREVQFMMSFRHPNVISALDFFIPLGGPESLASMERLQYVRETFDSVYVVMKKMDYTLREVLDSVELTWADVRAQMAESETPVPPAVAARADDEPVMGEEGTPAAQRHLRPLARAYRQFILYQLLRGLGYMHAGSVIHRDVKPENILLNRSYAVAISDFGQSRDAGLMPQCAPGGDGASDAGSTALGEGPGLEEGLDESSGNFQHFVETMLDNCTQWYASPETLSFVGGLMSGAGEAGAADSGVGFIDVDCLHAMDVWSAGCIAAEMLVGYPLFQTARVGGVAQMMRIVEVLGTPSEADTGAILQFRDPSSRPLLYKSLQRLLRGARATASPPRLEELLRSPYADQDDDEIALILALLRWNPRERIRVAEALASPYFSRDGYSASVFPEEDDDASTGSAARTDSEAEITSTGGGGDHGSLLVADAVRAADITDAVHGRDFLWRLFVRRHPEVGQLWRSLEAKQKQESQELQTAGAQDK